MKSDKPSKLNTRRVLSAPAAAPPPASPQQVFAVEDLAERVPAVKPQEVSNVSILPKSAVGSKGTIQKKSRPALRPIIDDPALNPTDEPTQTFAPQPLAPTEQTQGSPKGGRRPGAGRKPSNSMRVFVAVPKEALPLVDSVMQARGMTASKAIAALLVDEMRRRNG